MSGIIDAAMARKSVRTFDGRPLSSEDREKLSAFMEKIENPFGVPVTIKLLDAGEYGLKSPVIAGETLYVAGTVEKVPHGEEAFGFSLETLLLYAQSLGIGSVWIGGTMKREAFERAVGLTSGRRMPCVSPLGYPAEKRSVREVLMRKGVKADERKKPAELFFDGGFDKPLHLDGDMGKILEAVRWAPSAVNRQPWRIVYREGLWHFYEKKDKGFVSDAVGDMQKIDLGIAVCHFMMASEETGYSTALTVSDPGIETPAGTEYIASVSLEGQA